MSFKKFVRDSLGDAQRKISERAGQRVNKYTVRQRKIGLVIFGLVIGTFCFLLVMGITGSEDSGRALQVDSISVPKDIYRFSADSLKSIPAKIIDSLQSILKHFYNNRHDNH